MADGGELVTDGTTRPPHCGSVGVLAPKVGQVLRHGGRAVGVAVLERHGLGYLVHAQRLHPLAVDAWHGKENKVIFVRSAR